MDNDSITVSARELQAYETAMLTFLTTAHTIAAQLTRDGHAFAAPLRAEVDKAVFAHGSWYAAKWIASGKTRGWLQ